MKVPSPWEGYPPKWSVLEQLGRPRYGEIGFAEGMAFANRFAARYRFATSLTSITLKGYGSDTNAGYASLARVSLAYSAFEAFLKLIGVPYKDASRVLHQYPVAKWLQQLRQHDPKLTFFGFVSERVEGKHEKANVGQFLQGHGCDVTALARSVRHIFFHGELTPNANGSSPTDVGRLCDCLYSNLVAVMDGEFSTRLAPFERKPESWASAKSKEDDDWW